MPIRRGLSAPQNNFIETIIKRCDGPGESEDCQECKNNLQLGVTQYTLPRYNAI